MLGVLSITAEYFAGQAILSGPHTDIAISHPGVLRSLIGAALKFLPSNAGGAGWAINPDPNTLLPWVGFAMFCAGRAAIAIAAVLMVRRDT